MDSEVGGGQRGVSDMRHYIRVQSVELQSGNEI